MQAAAIYGEWRQSISYGKHTYQDIAESIDAAIARCKKEILNQYVRDAVVHTWEMMRARISEFAVGDDISAEDFPESIVDPISYAGSCFHCGRPIAGYEKKLKIIGPRRGDFWCCVDCNIKGL